MVRRVLALRTGRIAVGILSVVVLLALFGSLIAPQNPLTTSTAMLAGISGKHWLGTDSLGRHTFSRLLAGSRASVVGSLEAAGIALFVGAIPGILSVYL